MDRQQSLSKGYKTVIYALIIVLVIVLVGLGAYKYTEASAAAAADARAKAAAKAAADEAAKAKAASEAAAKADEEASDKAAAAAEAALAALRAKAEADRAALEAAKIAAAKAKAAKEKAIADAAKARAATLATLKVGGIRVDSGTDRYFSLAELEVYVGGKNIAVDGTATSDSFMYGGVPTRANDGNTDGIYKNKSVMHTLHPGVGWFLITFKDPVSLSDVDKIVLYNRIDHNTTLRKASISLLDEKLDVIPEYRFINESTAHRVVLYDRHFVGCYKDNPHRAFASHYMPPPLADGTVVSPYMTADVCSDYLKKNHPSVTHFGLQNNGGDGNPATGECWYGVNPKRKHDAYGKVDNCNTSNVGGPWANGIYRVR